MKNPLSKGATPTSPAKTGGNLPTAKTQGQVPMAGTSQPPKVLPNAAIVYGAAGGAFFTFSVLLVFGKHWLDGLLTFVPGLIFIGFALHIIKYGQPRK